MNEENFNSNPESNGNNIEQKVSRKRSYAGWMWTVGILVVLVVGFAALSTTDLLTQEQVRGETAAVVNGEEITMIEFENRLSQVLVFYEMQGVDVSDAETLREIENHIIEDMINERLVLQYARTAGLEVTDDEVEAEYLQVQSQFASEEEFLEALADEGFSPVELRRDIADQLLIQKYIERESEDRDLEVTDEEARSRYDELALDIEEFPPFEEISEEIKAEILQERLRDLIMVSISEMRAESEIEVFI